MMKPRKNVEETIRQKLRCTAEPAFRHRLLTDVMHAQRQSNETAPALRQAGLRRTIMRSPIVKLASVAAVIAVAALAISLLPRVTTPAYAIEQTYQALQNVRFLHIVSRDETGQVKDERWIEIGMHGYQVRYRQENPAPRNFLVIEDGQSTAVYRHDKKAVILYDRKDMQFQWVGELGKAFENLRQEGKILEENAAYKGRQAHKVWWPYLSAECYVDPQTKLPIAIGNSELSYEEPPAGTFEIIIPEDYAVLDKRPGAPAMPVPQWLLDEENAQANKAEAFRKGSLAFAEGDYAEAVRQFEQAQGWDSWAPFWLGSAHYHLGQYDLAIENYNKELEIWMKHDPNTKLPYCSYARGLAYAMGGNMKVAKTDFQACLPAMIKTLRLPSGGQMFEYAENPMIRYGKYKPSEQEMVIRMVNRLRLITGQNFGYDPNGTPEEKEAAIATWEQWLATDGTIRFTPNAELLPVSESAPMIR
jgi:tetratricopeptide (TPR) repeat protein